jgi:hypothetical protein
MFRAPLLVLPEAVTSDVLPSGLHVLHVDALAEHCNTPTSREIAVSLGELLAHRLKRIPRLYTSSPPKPVNTSRTALAVGYVQFLSPMPPLHA